MMSWKTNEERLIKLTLMRPAPKVNDLVVIFNVTGSKKDEFLEMLLSYFLFVESNEGHIHRVEEVVDAEDGTKCQLHIEIAGLRQNDFVQELQTKAQKYSGQVHEPR
jgi:hypothetical protein